MSDLKKDRLINAWLAVGPDGKTTDVSDVADASRGYASDIRRALESEEGGLSEEEIGEAYDPDLVEEYREELDDDAVGGEWSFDLREPAESGETDRETDRDREEPSGIDREKHRDPTATEESSEPYPEGQPTGPPTPSETRRPSSEGGSGDQPSQPSGGEPGPPSQQPPGGGGRDQPAQQRPPQRQASPGQGPRQASQEPGSPQQSRQPTAQQRPSRQPASRQPPSQQPPGPDQQPRGPQQGTQPSPPPQPRQQNPQPTQQQQAPQAPTGQQPQPQPVDVVRELAGLDEALSARQQQAEQEVQSLPPESRARSIAISKHNLIVEVRQSLSDIVNRL